MARLHVVLRAIAHVGAIVWDLACCLWREDSTLHPDVTLDYPYERYVRRCRKQCVDPLSREEYLRAGGLSSPTYFPTGSDDPGYVRYVRRCRRFDVDPLTFEEYREGLHHKDPLPPRCPSCLYDLRGNVSDRCPECGWYLQ